MNLLLIFLKNFQWDATRYSARKPLNEIVEGIQGEIAKIEEDMRVKVQAYSSIDSIITKSEKDETTSLLTRDLTNILKRYYEKEPVPEESDYITTIYVVVHRNEDKNWANCYESLTGWVLPRSSTSIMDDQDYKLYSVVTFKNFVEDFKTECRKHKFTVRKHEVNNAIDDTKREELKVQRDKRRKDLQRFCKTNYGEIYMAAIHIKAIRIFVESVLRFGLPPRYTSVIIEPHGKNDKKLLKVLSDHYKYLLTQELGDMSDLEKDKTSIGILGNEAFYPFVFLDIFIDKEEKH